jgi:hypothetical protein
MCDHTSFPGWPVFLQVFLVNITLNKQFIFISALIVLMPLVKLAEELGHILLFTLVIC